MSFTGKPNDAGEVDLMEDDIEENAMEVDNHVATDRFDDHCITDFGDANESGEMQNVTGKWKSTLDIVCIGLGYVHTFFSLTAAHLSHHS